MNCLSFLVVISVFFYLTVGNELECETHEVVNKCASTCLDEPTCETPNPGQIPHTPCLCKERRECDAKNGWIRSTTNGRCIQKSNCESAQCGHNEILNKCASKCVGEPTCQIPNPTQKPGTACITLCVKRCECDAKNGWIRNNGVCIKKDACPIGVCAKNEEQGCAPCCPDPTCQVRKPICPDSMYMYCPKKCYLTCRCKKGFIRNILTRECVPIGMCPTCSL